MFAIEIRLLAGRYGATTYNDRSVAEWPPHPGRLFSALVDTWADADEPDPAEHDDLRWLEQLPPPRIGCSPEHELVRRRAVTAYVPGNDPTALGKVAERVRKYAARDDALTRHRAEPSTRTERAAQKATDAYRDAVGGADVGDAPAAALEVLPEQRNRQPRQYPTVVPDDPVVTFVWPDTDVDEDRRDRLDALLGRVARLGHSATHVSCRVLAVEPEPPPRLFPRPGGGTFLRVPRDGLLNRLEGGFARHSGRGERRMPAALVEYGAPDEGRTEHPAGILSGDWVVLPLERPALRLPRTVELTRAVRDALAAAHPDAAEFLTGRFAHGLARPHVAVVALADVGHRWATGLIRGVALMLPRECSAEDRGLVLAAVDDAVSAQLSDGTALTFGDVEIAPAAVDAEFALWSDLPYALRRSQWCRPARTWASVTPVALDRHVRGLHRDPGADRRAADVVARACGFAGLPEPVDVHVAATPALAHVPRAAGRDLRRSFPPFVAGSTGQARQSTHVTITFEDRIAGPVLLGAGRYLGHGLLVPISKDDAS